MVQNSTTRNWTPDLSAFHFPRFCGITPFFYHRSHHVFAGCFVSRRFQRSFSASASACRVPRRPGTCTPDETSERRRAFREPRASTAASSRWGAFRRPVRGLLPEKKGNQRSQTKGCCNRRQKLIDILGASTRQPAKEKTKARFLVARKPVKAAVFLVSG